MLWHSGVHFHCFPGCYGESVKCKIVLQGEKWVRPKWLNAGLIIDQIIEKISL